MVTVSISISETCIKSINDYENVKKDENGAILKARIKNKLTKQTYEKFGHLTDTMRYICVDLLKEEFTRFSLKRKRNSFNDIENKEENKMRYYNGETNIEGDVAVCVMPDCNGKFVMIRSIVCGGFVYVDRVLYRESFDADVLNERLREWSPSFTMFECHKSYFPVIRDIREWMDDVRAMSTHANRDARISATGLFIREKVKFRGDYEELPEYAEFMESIMDYDGKDNYEGINCLSALCTYLARNYFSES